MGIVRTSTRITVAVLLTSSGVVSGVVVNAAPAAAAAHTYKVNTTADLPWQPNVCPKAVKGKCSLRAAIAQANMDNAGDTVTVPSGRYTLTVRALGDRTTPTGSNGFTDLNINGAMSIVGAGAAKTTVDGNNTWNVFTVDSPFGASVSISKLTISGGGESLDPEVGVGGGVNVEPNASLNLHDAVVSGNAVTGFGGGVYSAGFLTMNRVEVTGNESAGQSQGGTGVFQGSGGGVSVTGSATITNSTIDGNFGLRGGGINVNGGNLYLSESTVTGNAALNSGGGVRDINGLALIKFSTITGNCANTTTISCGAQGRGIDQAWQGGQSGGGVVNMGGGYMEIGGSIVAGNNGFSNFGRAPDDCYTSNTDNVLWSARNNLLGVWTPACNWNDLVDGTMVGDQDFYDLIGVPGDAYDPVLGPLANNGGPTKTQALQYGSDAIDGANGLTEFGGPAAEPITPDSWFDCDATDQRGKPRAVATYYGYPICDMGSYEYP